MFRIPFSFSRLFRLRGRRTAKADANLRRSSSAPAPFKSSQYTPSPAQVEPINVPPTPSNSSVQKRPGSLLINPFSGISPISKSPFTPQPSEVTNQSAPTPTIVIGRDAAEQSPAPLPPTPVPSDHLGPQIPADGVSLSPQPIPTHPNTRISFQLPTTLTRIDDRPETPLSTCSTLVSEIGARPDAENVVDSRTDSASAAPFVDRERIPALNEEAAHSGGVGAAPAAPTDCSNVTKARRASLFTLQSVRPDGVHVNRSRFSLPARPRTEPSIAIGNADGVTRDGRREGRRASLLSLASTPGSTSPRKEGRMARFSKELSKPETQEVLRALTWRM